MIKEITKLFKLIIRSGYTPRSMREMQVVFLPKIGKSDYSEPKAYRPITLSSFLLETPRKGIKAKTIDMPKLSEFRQTTISTFKAWQESFEGYLILSRAKHECDLQGRRHLLRSALDSTWQEFWTNGGLKVAPEDDVQDIIHKMYAYLRLKRNALLDRHLFFQRNQSFSESVDEYHMKLEALLSQCNYGSKMNAELHEEILRDRIISGLNSKEVQERLLEKPLETLTLEKTLNIVRAAEVSKQGSKELNDESVINKVTKMEGNFRRKYQKSSYRQEKESSLGQKCLRCGGQHAKECPAKQSSCNFCHKQGHWEKQCYLKRNSVQQNEIEEDPKEINTIHLFSLKLNRKFPAPTATILTTVGNTTKPLRWLLDTGAEASIMSPNHLEVFGKPQLKPVSCHVQVADGSRVKVLGKIIVTVEHRAIKKQIEVLVVTGPKQCIMSFTSLVDLNIIPKGWPKNIDVQAISMNKDMKNELVFPKEIENKELREELFKEFAEVFPEDESIEPLRPMKGPEMKIELSEDAKPFKRFKANTIPFHWQDSVKKQLEVMVKKCIIEPVPLGQVGDWVLAMVPVPKQGGSGEPRITIDFVPLNKYVKRQGYPTRTPAEEISQIPGGMMWFTTLDSRHGYWQVPLAKESQHLTTFITPWGHFRFKRNAMGLINAGDEHNERGDKAIEGIPNVKKIVEDIIIYDMDYETHVRRVKEVLKRCKEHGITLSRKKAHIAQRKVDWCGYTLCREGYTVSQKLVEGLTKFPCPKNRTDVRSFCGLVQQFEALSPHLTDLMEPIRALLSPKVTFLWTEDQEKAFKDVIKELSSPRVLTFFRADANLRLETDAAQKTGFGFALWQEEPNGMWKLLRCGSRTVSSAESRYSVTESELTAVVSAIKKLRLYLRGKKFTLITDHKPLVPILNHKGLDEIESPRIVRLKEKLSGFKFNTEWRQGVKHTVADVFSRYPVSTPTCEDQEGEKDIEDFAKEFAISAVKIVDPILDGIKEETFKDKIQCELKKAITEGFPQKNMNPLLSDYYKLRDSLTVTDDLILFGTRIVVPQKLRKCVLQKLHAAHQGLERTLRRARQCVFWPGITNDINNIVRNCKQCEVHKASQRKEPLLQDERPTRPGEAIAADLFSCEGREYLAITDKYSGWLDVSDFPGAINSLAVQKTFMEWFLTMGVPNRLTTDNGPQFKSEEFSYFCQEWGIEHDKSSPYHHISNGYGEAAVCSAKDMVRKRSKE
jgi:hypothetical protein